MLTRATRPLLCLALLGTVAAGPTTAPTTRATYARTPDRAVADGVAFLVADQNPDGSWGTGTVSHGNEIMVSVPGSHQAFRTATTALCVMALGGAGRHGFDGRRAYDRGLQYLLNHPDDVRRGDGQLIYNVWAHCYVVQALAAESLANPRLRTDPRLRAAVTAQLARLADYQTYTGGWDYYDFDAQTKQPSGGGTSFGTAAGLVALFDAKRAGFAVSDAMVQRCLRRMHDMRLPNGAYLYGTDYKFIPTLPANLPRGSLGRTQAANFAQRLWDDKTVDATTCRNGLDFFFRDHAAIEAGRKRPLPHTSWYQTSGYYYYFDHYYAARLIELLGPDAKATYGPADAGRDPAPPGAGRQLVGLPDVGLPQAVRDGLRHHDRAAVPAMRAATRRAVGFLLLASAAAAAPAAREVDVTFPTDDGLHLAGTLALPAAARPVAAMVLVAGSGPTDRNGNQPPALRPDLLRTMADELAHRGIATLRYDKRGQYANGVQAPRDPAALAAFCAWGHYVGDAGDAVAWLRRRPEVDPGRVGILGHSEGGLLALCAAADLTRAGRPPSALILLSTPGRPVDRVVADQLAHALRGQHLPSVFVRYVLNQNADVCRSLRQTGGLPATGVSAWLAPLYPPYLNAFWHGELAVNPPALATAFAGPVLVVNGTADAQVSADRDAAALAAALARRPHDRHQLLLVPGCGHNLKPVAGGNDAGVIGDVPAATLGAIGGWAADHL